MTEPETQPKAIEIKVEEISQLFDTLDPFPFRERDLNKDAEEYIVSWARELPKDQPLKVIVYLPEAEAATTRAKEFAAAFANYFEYRAGVVDRDLKELFRVGWRSLAIGIGVLALCVVASHALAGRLGAGQLGRFVQESLIILGWVANWKPIQIFLYDWWPLARRRNLFRRIAAAAVEFKPERYVEKVRA